MLRLVRFLPRRFWSPRAWRSWGEYVHWRLETFGVYHPEGRFNRKGFRQLVKQFPSYYRWLGQIDRIRRR
jgi:hypothetical protein